MRALSYQKGRNVNKLETVAQNKGVSVNNLVVQCCEYALANLDAAQGDAKAT
jgi:EAL domain-containing protein (putative c-di-GMP-specific phosphodiesterase class I)